MFQLAAQFTNLLTRVWLADPGAARWVFLNSVPGTWPSLATSCCHTCPGRSARFLSRGRRYFGLVRVYYQAVFKDAFYFVLVSTPTGGPGGFPDCHFPSGIGGFGAIPARIRWKLVFTLNFHFGLKRSWVMGTGVEFVLQIRGWP